MSKLKIKRIFIKDEQGKFYRICGITNTKDATGEYYVKILFPDQKNIPLIGTTNNEKLEIIDLEIVGSGVQEFTYHYKSGVSHYKASESEFVDQKRLLPKLSDFKGLFLLRYTIHLIDFLKPYKESDVSPDDLVLNDIFCGRSRDFEFGIYADPDIRMTNVGPAKQLKLYVWELDEPNVYMGLCDLEYLNNFEAPSIATQIFRYDDPVTFLSPLKNYYSFLDYIKLLLTSLLMFTLVSVKSFYEKAANFQTKRGSEKN